MITDPSMVVTWHVSEQSFIRKEDNLVGTCYSNTPTLTTYVGSVMLPGHTSGVMGMKETAMCVGLLGSAGGIGSALGAFPYYQAMTPGGNYMWTGFSIPDENGVASVQDIVIIRIGGRYCTYPSWVLRAFPSTTQKGDMLNVDRPIVTIRDNGTVGSVSEPGMHVCGWALEHYHVCEREMENLTRYYLPPQERCYVGACSGNETHGVIAMGIKGDLLNYKVARGEKGDCYTKSKLTHGGSTCKEILPSKIVEPHDFMRYIVTYILRQ